MKKFKLFYLNFGFFFLFNYFNYFSFFIFLRTKDPRFKLNFPPQFLLKSKFYNHLNLSIYPQFLSNYPLDIESFDHLRRCRWDRLNTAIYYIFYITFNQKKKIYIYICYIPE